MPASDSQWRERRAQDAQRLWTYIVLSVGLLIVYGLAERSAWQGSTQLHTNMELVATFAALVVGLVALLRYYARKNNTILLIGVGFVGTAMLDGYHTVVTSTFFREVFPSPPPSLIPWSWNASRTFLALLMFLSWWAWRREQNLGEQGRLSEGVVYTGVTLLTVAIFCFFVFVPLPRAYLKPEEFIYGRPEEFLSAALFVGALGGYLKKGAWRKDPLEFWVINSLIVGVVTQTLVMSRSYALFDAMFDMAHLLKIVSYCLVLTGLLFDMYVVFSRVERSARELSAKNEALRREASERKRLEEATQRLASIVEYSDDAIIGFSLEGMIETWNTGAVRLYRRTAEEAIGHPISVLSPEDRQYEAPEVLRRLAEGRVIEHRETVHVRKDGSLVDVALTVSPIRDPSGGLKRAAAVVHDISAFKELQNSLEQRVADRTRSLERVQRATLNMMQDIDAARRELAVQTEHLARSNRELDDFAYVASHDLRAPLRGIDNLAKWIADDAADVLPGKSRTHLEKMRQRVNRMEGLLDDLLQYSRAGRKKGSVEDIATGDLVREIVDMISPADGFTVSVDPEMPIVQSDRAPLRQVFLNLIANALKHHDRAEGRVEISARDNGEFVEFSVADDGPGIPPEYHERVFRMFQTLQPRDQVEGSGMGLAVVKKVIENHGGSISLESPQGRGTRFRFTWRKTEPAAILPAHCPR